MNPHLKELNINSDLKEARSAASSTYSSDSDHCSNQESKRTQTPPSRSLLSVIKQGICRSRSPSPAPPSNTSRATTPTPANPPRPRPSPQPKQDSSTQSPTTMARASMYDTNTRTVSMSSTTSSVSSSMTSSESYSTPKRSSTGQSDFERMAYGRHSSEWLFGNASISGVFKKAVSKKPESG